MYVRQPQIETYSFVQLKCWELSIYCPNSLCWDYRMSSSIHCHIIDVLFVCVRTYICSSSSSNPICSTILNMWRCVSVKYFLSQKCMYVYTRKYFQPSNRINDYIKQHSIKSYIARPLSSISRHCVLRMLDRGHFYFYSVYAVRGIFIYTIYK